MGSFQNVSSRRLRCIISNEARQYIPDVRNVIGVW